MYALKILVEKFSEEKNHALDMFCELVCITVSKPVSRSNGIFASGSKMFLKHKVIYYCMVNIEFVRHRLTS